MSDEFTLEDLDGFDEPTVTVEIPFVPQALVDEHSRLNAELVRVAQEDVDENRDPESFAIAEQVVELERQMAASIRRFTFRSIGTTAWTELAAAHPPTREERHVGHDVNPETFEPAAVAASAASPTISLETAVAMRARLGVVRWQKLWRAARDANVGDSDLPKSVLATDILQLSVESSTTASPEESPDQGSLEEA